MELFDYAFFPNFEESVFALANLAASETWCFANDRDQNSILKSYLEHTFRRLKFEKKIKQNQAGSHFIFNTGLFTTKFEEIYAFFKEHRNPPATNPTQKFFIGFRKGSDIEVVSNFDQLPERANYFERPEYLIFDPNKTIAINIDHIVDDNISRLPEAYRGDRNIMMMLLNGAIEKSKKLATLDYKIAIPQCHNNNIQLLLPLFITSEETPDVALVLANINNSYRASTILTLRMAYNNARLIVKPGSYWLSPQSVN
jgi:hypothetical protein